MYKNTLNQIKVNSNHQFDGFEKGTYLNPDIELIIDNIPFDKSNVIRHNSRLDNWFYGSHNSNIIYFEDSFFGLKNQMILQDLDKPKTIIRCNKNVLRLDKIYPPRSRKSFNDLFNSVINIKLINKGYTKLHAATLSKDNHGVLLLAFPNVGKSLSTMQLLNDGYKYLSDDAVLIHANGIAYLTKFSSAIGYNDFLKYINPEDIGKFNYYKKLINSWIIQQNKMLERVMKHSHIILGDMFDTVESAKIDTVCVLELGPRNITQLSNNELLNKRFAVDSYSLGRFNNPFLFVYDYFNDWSLKAVEDKERDNIKQFLTGADCYRLSCNNWDWDEVIKEIL